jgi:NAD(P)-dependent dehydrogenase (short-subunit alcohol dehydrogenase family)
MLKLKDKVVMISCGGSELGREIASRFQAEGAIIALNVYPPDAELSQAGYDMITHGNPESGADIHAAVGAVLDKYGRIDVVVHNDNEVIPAELETASDEDFDRAIAVNVKSAFLYGQAAGRAMKKAKQGAFVFISSIHDEKPNGAAFTYSIAKGALKMLTREMVLDLGPSNIRINMVNVGPLEGDEERFRTSLSPLYEHARERIQNQQYISPGDVANAALFFAGDDCKSANGATVVLDGGFLLTYVLAGSRRGRAEGAKS